MTRRFSMTDAMVLVGATAVGFSVIRTWVGPVFWTSGVTIFAKIRVIEVILTSVCFYWSMAVLIIGLRHPRPPLRLICRRPGMAACFALNLAGLTILVNNFVMIIPVRHWNKFPSNLTDLILAASTTNHQLAPSIAVAWAVLALSGRWRSDSGWTDRLGRGIGSTLLGLFVIQTLQMYYLEIF